MSRDATSVVIYPDAETDYSPRGYMRPAGDHVTCRVDIDRAAAIQTNSWQAMQRLVDALTVAITQAKQSEQDFIVRNLPAVSA